MEFAIGLGLLFLAVFCARKHYIRWRDNFDDAADEYIYDWLSGITFTITYIGIFFILGAALTYGAFNPDLKFDFVSGFPYVHITSKPALSPVTQ